MNGYQRMKIPLQEKRASAANALAAESRRSMRLRLWLMRTNQVLLAAITRPSTVALRAWPSLSTIEIALESRT